MQNSDPLVSIACITYNQEKYIRETIEGFLIQKTTFPIEIIIHDDASTDNTAKIVEEYATEYPNLIVPIYQVENQYSQGIKPWPNFIFPRARGKYIAFCEGDDFWTDPQKLQKQVEFLEANPDYSLCSHEVYYTFINDPNTIRKFAAILYRNYELDGIKSFAQLLKLFISNDQEFWKRRRKSSKTKRYSSADFTIALDTASSSRYIPTLSIVARTKYLQEMPSKLFKLTAGHRLVILWSAIYGKIKHFNEVMGVKNTQENSVTVTKILHKTSTKLSRIQNTIKMYNIMKLYVEEKDRKVLNRKIEEAIKSLPSKN